VVRIEHRADAVILWLSGTLDRATSALLDRELDAQAGRPMPVVVDLTGLEFVDSSGLDTLVRIHQRAGHSGEKLCFRQGRQGAQRPLELIRNVGRRSRLASRRARVTIEDSYSALAMACADVDHPRPGDRPAGTLYRFPDQAAGASGAAPPPRVARAAPPRALLKQPHNGIRPSALGTDSSMNCYVCALAGTENYAVGHCDVCSVGLCVKHIGENATRHGPLSAHPDDCLHHPGYQQDPPPITRIPISAGDDRPSAA
jgi:anti-anti-sigma factor